MNYDFAMILILIEMGMFQMINGFYILIVLLLPI